MRTSLFLVLTLTIIGCSQAVVSDPAQDTWTKLRAQYDAIEAVRASNPVPQADRREQIEVLLKRQQQLEPIYAPFVATLRTYVEQTADPRAKSLFARERILMGDEYAYYLARYDRAIRMYRSALEMDPDNAAIRDRIAAAEQRLFLSSQQFGRIQPSMTQAEVAALIGYPRVDWVRENIRDGRVYAVWIYPKEDGGAAAVYFDNGVLYHKNWDAAPAESSGS